MLSLLLQIIREKTRNNKKTHKQQVGILKHTEKGNNRILTVNKSVPGKLIMDAGGK